MANKKNNKKNNNIKDVAFVFPKNSSNTGIPKKLHEVDINHYTLIKQ